MKKILKFNKFIGESYKTGEGTQKRKTLSDFIDSKYSFFDTLNGNDSDKLDERIVSKFIIGLFLLTQSTNESDSLTNSIVNISKLFESEIRSKSKNGFGKYLELLDINSDLHNIRPDRKEMINSIVLGCQIFEYVRDYYLESGVEGDLDLNEYNNHYKVIRNKAEEVFKESIWYKK